MLPAVAVYESKTQCSLPFRSKESITASRSTWSTAPFAFTSITLHPIASLVACLQVFLAIADQAVPLHMPAHANCSTTDAGSGRPSPVAGRSQSTPREGAAAAAASTDAADAGNGLVHGAALYWQQFGALFVKRMLSARCAQQLAALF